MSASVRSARDTSRRSSSGRACSAPAIRSGSNPRQHRSNRHRHRRPDDARRSPQSASGSSATPAAAEGVLRYCPPVHASRPRPGPRPQRRDGFGRSSSAGLIDRHPADSPPELRRDLPRELLLSARVLHPTSPAEDRGLEDARFTRFDDDDGSVTYYATYTAFDGSRIAPHLIQTDDFRTFSMRQLTGTAATNKGMALFPRRVDGTFWAVSRWDRENLSVTHSDDVLHWQEPGRGAAAPAPLGPRPARHVRVAHRDPGRLARHHPRRRTATHVRDRGDAPRPRRPHHGARRPRRSR